MRFIFEDFVDEEFVREHHGKDHLVFLLFVGLPELLVDMEKREVGGEGGRGQQFGGGELVFLPDGLEELGKRGAVFEHDDELLFGESRYFEFVVLGLQEPVAQL